MREIQGRVWLVIVLSAIHEAHGYVAGPVGLPRQDRGNDGMCITLNQPCALEDSQLIASYSSINNQMGCAEKCSENSNCGWWTWYDRSMDNSYPFDCLLFTDCSLVSSRCNFCYTGDNDCYSQNLPHATLLIGGENNQEPLVTSVEIFAEGKGPICNVMADIPSELASGEVVGAVAADTIYLCGSGSNHTSVCFTYTLPIKPDKNWEVGTINPMTSSRTLAASVSAYGEVYVIGGLRASQEGNMASPYIEVFNPSTNEWKGVATHDAGGGEARPRAGHCAIRHREAIYLIGGQPFEQVFMTVDLFNISTKTWQNFPSYRVPNLQHIACTLVGNDSILVSGGQTLNETLGGFWSWNVTTKAWKELPSLIVPRHSHVMDYFDGVPTVAGGRDSNNEALNSIEIFKNNTWIQNPGNVTLNTERSKFVKIYVPKYLVMFPNKSAFNV